MSGCQDCFSNCADRQTTDRCVQYTGVDIPILGVCNGDSLYEIEVIILEKLQELAIGDGIDLSSVTIGCTFLTNILNGQDKTLKNLVQMLITASCSLRAMVQILQNEIGTPLVISAPCLTLPANPTRDDILTAVVTKLCSLNTIVTTIQSDYQLASTLCADVTACIAAGSTQEYTRMPKNVAMAYMGSLSVFDSTGKGLSAFGYDKVYICNGNNGTQDLRGRALVGANTNVVGPSLDAAVDPSLAANAGYNIAQTTKKGTYTVTLTTAQIPAHTHGVTDPGHTHLTGNIGQFMRPCGSACAANYEPGGGGLTSNSNTTGITINSTGGNQPHNTLAPSFGVVYVVYLP